MGNVVTSRFPFWAFRSLSVRTQQSVMAEILALTTKSAANKPQLNRERTSFSAQRRSSQNTIADDRELQKMSSQSKREFESKCYKIALGQQQKDEQASCLQKCLSPPLPPLSEGLLSQVVEMFETTDIDKSGDITMLEATTFFKKQGKVAARHAKAMFSKVDTDGNGSCDLSEWISYWRELKRNSEGKEETLFADCVAMYQQGSWMGRQVGKEMTKLIATAFMKVDLDNSGSISAHEARKFFQKMGARSYAVPSSFVSPSSISTHMMLSQTYQELAANFFHDFDADGSGDVSLQEWQDYWSNRVLTGKPEIEVKAQLAEFLARRAWLSLMGICWANRRRAARYLQIGWRTSSS